MATWELELVAASLGKTSWRVVCTECGTLDKFEGEAAASRLALSHKCP